MPDAYGGSTLGDALARLEAERFVGRDRELAIFDAWLTSDDPLPAILNVSGPGGVGKSALLQAFCRRATTHGRPVMRADGYDVAADSEHLLRALTQTQPEEALDKINTAKPLIVLDTFEELAPLTRYLEECFLPALAPGVKVVVSGRLPVGRALSRQVPWHDVILAMPLSALSPADSKRFLEAAGVTDQRLADQILRATGGQPLALSMAVDLVEQFGVRDFDAATEWRLRLRSLVERLLRDVPDPLLRTLLEACTVVRHFDEPTLAAVSGLSDIGPSFDHLCRLSVVRASDHGLMLHEDVRKILGDDLRWRQPERYRELEVRRSDYYRARVRTVGRAEREWLVAERLYLWGNSVFHTMLFGEDDPGDVWVVPGSGEDAEELWSIFVDWLRSGMGGEVPVQFDDYPLEQARPFTMAILTHPHARIRIARDREGTAVGFSTVMPITRSTYELLGPHPIVGPVLQAYLTADEVAALPAEAEDATVFQLLQLAYTGDQPEAVRSELMREMFGVFARSGVYLITLPIPSWKTLFEALGFQPLDAARHSVWTGEVPTDGYVLDLTRVGVERWIEAVLAGQAPTSILKPVEIAQELQRVLASWNDDDALACSRLIELCPASPDDPKPHRAQSVRDLVHTALARARSGAARDAQLGFRALELAYLDKQTSHEAVASQLAVSRTQFYRLLKRATTAVAQVLAAA